MYIAVDGNIEIAAVSVLSKEALEVFHMLEINWNIVFNVYFYGVKEWSVLMQPKVSNTHMYEKVPLTKEVFRSFSPLITYMNCHFISFPIFSQVF